MRENSKRGKAQKGEFRVSEFLEYEPLHDEKYGEDHTFDDLEKAVSAARELADNSPHRGNPNYTILIYTPDSKVFLVGDDSYFFEKGLLFVLYEGKLKKIKEERRILKSLPVRLAKRNGVFEGSDGSFFKVLQLDNGQWTIEVFSISGSKMGNHGSFSHKGDAIDRIKFLCSLDLDEDDWIEMPIRFKNITDIEDTMDCLGYHLGMANNYLYPAGYEVSVKFSATPKEPGSGMPVFEGDDLSEVMEEVEAYLERNR